MSPAGLRFNWDEARCVHRYVTVCMCMCVFIKKDWIFRQIHREIQGSYRHLRNFLLLLLLLLFKKTVYASVRSLISFCYCTCGNINMLWSCRSTNPHSEVFFNCWVLFSIPPLLPEDCHLSIFNNLSLFTKSLLY